MMKLHKKSPLFSYSFLFTCLNLAGQNLYKRIAPYLGPHFSILWFVLAKTFNSSDQERGQHCVVELQNINANILWPNTLQN